MAGSARSASWASATRPPRYIATATSTAIVSAFRSSSPWRVPPYLQSILAELHRLDMRAPQVQSPHLVDNEVTQRRVSSEQEPAIRLKMLEGQIVGRVAAALIGVTRVGFGQQRVHGVAVRIELIDVVFAESSLGDRLHHPVHLNHVPGGVNLRQGQPVQLTLRGAEARREDRNSAKPGGSSMPVVSCRKSLAAIGSGEKNAHRLNRCFASAVSTSFDNAQVPETWACGSDVSVLLPEQVWAFCGEPREVFVDASLGLGEICGGMVDSDGQIAKFRRQPSRPRRRWRASSSWADCRVSCVARPGTRWRRKLIASALVNGETSRGSACRTAWPVPLPQGDDDMPSGRLAGRYLSTSNGLATLS